VLDLCVRDRSNDKNLVQELTGLEELNAAKFGVVVSRDVQAENGNNVILSPIMETNSRPAYFTRFHVKMRCMIGIGPIQLPACQVMLSFQLGKYLAPRDCFPRS